MNKTNKTAIKILRHYRMMRRLHNYKPKNARMSALMCSYPDNESFVNHLDTYQSYWNKR